MRYLHLIALLVLLLDVSSRAAAQDGRKPGSKNASLVVFDWNCSSPSADPIQSLKQIVQRTMNEEDFTGFGTWADRAVAFDLNGDRKNEYFVPLDCGGTGNCAWGLFALSPRRRLGILSGQYIYVQKRRREWPKLIVYGHVTAIEGVLTTYHVAKGRYIKSSHGMAINHGEFALQIQGGMGHKMPKFLKAAKPICKSVGD